MSMRMVLISGVLTGLVGLSPALADDPSAMVEDITSFRDDVQLMDYLTPGQEISLGTDETIIIGYFASCLQETITGGTVTIGEYESMIDSGNVDLDRGIDCDDQVITYAESQQQEAGTTVVRAGSPCEDLVPDVVIYDISPLVRLVSGGASVEYTNLCEENPAAQVLGAEDGVVDFRASGITLVVGELYRIEAGDREVLVLVSQLAESDSPSLLSRYIPL